MQFLLSGVNKFETKIIYHYLTCLNKIIWRINNYS